MVYPTHVCVGGQVVQERRGLGMGADATEKSEEIPTQPRVLRTRESHKISVFLGHHKFKHQAHQAKPQAPDSSCREKDRASKPKTNSLT